MIAILRGATYDGYGDLSDAATEVTGGIPAILAETSKTVMDPATATPRTIRSATCKLPHWAQVKNTDQIRDQVTGNVYAIIDITQPPSFTSMPAGGPVDLLLTLRRITGSGT